MPFNGVLLKNALVAFTLTITNMTFAQGITKPVWGLEEIRASQIIHTKESDLPSKPVFDVNDPQNLLPLVEQDKHHVTLFDGDMLKPVHRFKSKYALHGEPVYSPSGRFIYFSSRDGWISKYDIFNLKLIAEIRAGISTRNLALSADGRYVMVANYLPHSLVLLDARDLNPLKLYAAKDEHGKTSRVSAVYTAPPRNSFIAAFKDIPELWEIYYENDPPQGFGMWMHDYRVDSGENTAPEAFPIRRIRADNYLDGFSFDQEYVSVIGLSRGGKGQVADMDIGRVIVDLDLPGIPGTGSGIYWEYEGRQVLALPNLMQGIVSIIDMETWKVIRQIETSGPGQALSNHKNSSYVWVHVFSGPDKGAVHVIDKNALEVVKTLQPGSGNVITRIEFTRSGRYVILSIQDIEDTIVIYDANKLEEIKRLSVSRPLVK